jgi:hypothetical protein
MPLRWLFLLSCLVAQAAWADTLIGRVVAIADGDTLTVLDSRNHHEKLTTA